MIIDGVVLAGGLSSRMREDKAYLKRDERDMLTYTVELISQLPIQHLFISRNEASSGARLPHTLVSDIVPNIGPLGGIYSTAIRSSAEALIITPVDLPLLRKDDLAALIDEGMRACRPAYFTHHYLPLFLPLTPEVRQYLENVAEGSVPQRSVNTLCTNFGAIEIVPEIKSRLTNVNTPAQWTAAKKLLALAEN